MTYLAPRIDRYHMDFTDPSNSRFTLELVDLSLTLAAVDVLDNFSPGIQSIVDNPVTAPLETLGPVTIGGGRAESEFSSTFC